MTRKYHRAVDPSLRRTIEALSRHPVRLPRDTPLVDWATARSAHGGPG